MVYFPIYPILTQEGILSASLPLRVIGLKQLPLHRIFEADEEYVLVTSTFNIVEVEPTFHKVGNILDIEDSFKTHIAAMMALIEKYEQIPQEFETLILERKTNFNKKYKPLATKAAKQLITKNYPEYLI